MVPLSEILGSAKPNDLQTSFEFPPHEIATVPKLSDLSTEEISEIKDGQRLIDVIAKHFHTVKPKPYKIGNEEFLDNEDYSLEKTAAALGIRESSLKLYHTVSQGFKIYKEHGKTYRYSGYEIVRLHLKRKLSAFSLDDLSGMFYISKQVAEKLVELKVLKTGKKGAIDNESLLEFFDQIFPKKEENPRYSYVVGLVNSAIDHLYEAVAPSMPAETQALAPEILAGTRLVPPTSIKIEPVPPVIPKTIVATPSTIEAIVGPVDKIYYPNDEKTYKSLSAISKLLVEGADYKLAPRAEKPYEDAFDVRHWDLKDNKKKRPENIQVNWRDIRRAMLAKHFQDEETVRKEFENKGLPFDREYVAKSLEKAAMPIILYNNKSVFVPGTVQIVELSPEEIEIIGEYAKPFINKHGPLISLRQISELVGASFIPTDFLRTKKKGISFVKINDEPMYNLFHVVRAYLPAFEKRG